MNRYAGLCFAAFLCVIGKGCVPPSQNFVNITNSGPNTVTITSAPSPKHPKLPCEIAAGDSQEFEYDDKDDTATIHAVDMTTLKSGQLVNLDLDRPSTSEDLELEWTGDNLVDNTPARQSSPLQQVISFLRGLAGGQD